MILNELGFTKKMEGYVCEGEDDTAGYEEGLTIQQCAEHTQALYECGSYFSFDPDWCFCCTNDDTALTNVVTSKGYNIYQINSNDQQQSSWSALGDKSEQTLKSTSIAM